MYLLDTNIISYWMRGDKVVTEKIKITRLQNYHCLQSPLLKFFTA